MGLSACAPFGDPCLFWSKEEQCLIFHYFFMLFEFKICIIATVLWHEKSTSPQADLILRHQNRQLYPSRDATANVSESLILLNFE